MIQVGQRGVALERLFAVERTGPAVDISDDVVRAWAEKSRDERRTRIEATSDW